VDGRVEVPTNKVTFLEFVRLLLDSVALQDELENGQWTSLDKINRYFYKKILSLLINSDKSDIPFK
jgi:hypothetical protein